MIVVIATLANRPGPLNLSKLTSMMIGSTYSILIGLSQVVLDTLPMISGGSLHLGIAVLSISEHGSRGIFH